MIGRLKRIKTNEGRQAEFESLFKELDALVKSNESGCKVHELYKSPTDNHSYVVVEQYVDEGAVDAHTESERAYFDRIRPLLEKVEIETFRYEKSDKIAV
ncbi:MAG: putative quinol monooxygenase [Nitrososphaerales archaeon]